MQTKNRFVSLLGEVFHSHVSTFLGVAILVFAAGGVATIASVASFSFSLSEDMNAYEFAVTVKKPSVNRASAQTAQCPAPSLATATNRMLGCVYNWTLSPNPEIYRGQVNEAPISTVGTTSTVLNKVYGAGAPIAAAGVDRFYQIWQGTFSFAAANYTFNVTGDDGIRVFVDGVLLPVRSAAGVTNSYVNQAETLYTGTKAMTAGIHLIKVEQFDTGGDAVARLNWVRGAGTTPTPAPSPTPTSCSLDQPNAFCAAFWNDAPYSDGSNVANHFRTAVPGAARIEANGANGLNYTWTGSPAAGVNADYWSAAWAGSFYFDGSAQTFTVTSDDGVRIYVDSTLILDRFAAGVGTFSVNYTVPAGNHRISVHYYDATGNGVLKLSWAKVAAPVSCSLDQPNAFCAAFWNDAPYSDGSNVANHFRTAVPGAARIEANGANGLNYTWTGSPAAGVNADYWSAAWAGSFYFDGSAQTFTVTSDDGVRIYVDSTLILDRFAAGVGTFSVNYTVPAGNHRISVHYYDATGNGVLKLGWAKVTTPTPPAPTPTPTPVCNDDNANAFCGKYWNDAPYTDGSIVSNHFKTLAATRVEAGGAAGLNFTWAGSPVAGVNADYWSAAFAGSFYFEGGDYAFATANDDGVKVFIDSTLVIDKFKTGPDAHGGKFYVAPGNHRVSVHYYDQTGAGYLKVHWFKLMPNATTYKDLIGITSVAPMYTFTNKSFLQEGREAVSEVGARTIGIWLPGSENSNGVYEPTTVNLTSLKAVASTPLYQALWADPRFDVFMLTIPGALTSSKNGVYTSTGYNNPINYNLYNSDKNEYKDLALYLGKTYPTKKFIIKNWEGDYGLQGHYSATVGDREPTPTLIENYLNATTARNAGVKEAQAEGRLSNVYSAVELVLLKKFDAAGTAYYNRPSVLNSIIPYVSSDYVSYSAYQSTNTGDRNLILSDIAFIKNHPGVKGRQVLISEFGTNYADQGARVTRQIAALKDAGVLKAVYWEMYDNGCYVNPSKTAQQDPACMPFGVINMDGSKAPAYDVFKNLITTSPGYVAPARTAPVVTSVQGQTTTGAIVAPSAKNYLLINGKFVADSATRVTVGGRQFGVVSQTPTQIKVLLDSYGGNNLQVIVSDSYGFSLPFKVNISSVVASVSGAIGLDQVTGKYYTDTIAGKYLVIYGSFTPSGNTVYINGQVQPVAFQSTGQINVIINSNITGGQAVIAGNLVIGNVNGNSLAFPLRIVNTVPQ